MGGGFFVPGNAVARQSGRVMPTNSGSAEVLPTHTAALFEAAVKRAVGLLRAGEVVALPTETVYGLAANALDADAVARIFAAKGRPAHNPVIVHVADVAMARHCAGEWTDAAERLARAFWPGPLTIVVRRGAGIPDVVTAGGDTVGLRWPSHPFMQAVIRACGFPLAAPSANLSNSISPTNAAHVRHGLGGRIPLIVDGGQSQVGIESTVIDATTPVPRVLRPGMIHSGAIAAALGNAGETGAALPEAGGGTLRSPGLLQKHYSPKARVLVLSWVDDAGLRQQLRERGVDAARVQVVAHSIIPGGPGFGGVSVIPRDAEAYARALYAELHRCDEAGADWIVVEQLPDGAEWEAIGDRLRRAASD